MQYELIIEKGKEETIISYLKKFDFVTVRKKNSTQKKAVKKETDFSYFGAMPDWDFDFDDLRKNNFRKIKTKW